MFNIMQALLVVALVIEGCAHTSGNDHTSDFKPYHREHPIGFNAEDAKIIDPSQVPREVAIKKPCDPVTIKEGLDIDAEIDNHGNERKEKQSAEDARNGGKPFSATLNCKTDY